MSVDPYSLCPGGTGKKLKFCCSDLLHELGKIDHMLAAEQRQACVDYITQLEAKFPDRACLLTTKALVLHSLEQNDEAARAAERVLATQPANPVALAAQALVLVEGDDPREALRPLHQALTACGTQIPQRVYETVGLVAEALLAEGYITAAFAHSIWQLQLKHDYEPALMVAYRIQSSQGIPLPLKDIRLTFKPAPEAAAYKAEFDAALDHAYNGHWLAAADAFDALMFRAAGCAALWHNLGLLRAYLANEAGAAEALRRYASLDVPPDDAVDAEMLALALDPKITEATLDQMRVRYQLGDLDAVIASLTASRMAAGESVENLQPDDPDEPPPRALFSLFDRPMPPAGPGLTAEQLPFVIGYALVYGRQTDREPRLEILCERRHLELAKTAVRQSVGEALGHAMAEEVAAQLPAQPFSYTGHTRLPPDSPPEQILSLVLDQRRNYVCEQWPAEPNLLFGGRTPRQAASDRSSRVAVLAAIALWELNYGDSIDFNELRRALDLPPAEAIDPPSGFELQTLPLVRLHRLDVKKLSDEQLSLVWRRATLFRAKLACARLAPEVVCRETMSAAERAQAEGMRAGFTTDFAKGLEHLSAARALAKTAGISCAGWDLEELSLRLTAGQLGGFMELVQHISSAHRNEAGVQERLFQFLYEVGVIDEQGRPRSAAAPSASDLVVPGGAAAAAGKIWTPESEAGEKKSALWVPGT